MKRPVQDPTRPSAVVERAAWLVAVVVCAGCENRIPAFSVTSIDPMRVPDNAATPVTIQGAQFEPWVQANFDSPGASAVDAAFAASVSQGGPAVALGAVRLVDAQHLSAIVPSGLALGVYDLSVVDPRGRSATLSRGLTVYSGSCPVDGGACNDGDPCTMNDVCVAGICRGTPYACVASQCQASSVCDGTGACTVTNRADGTACDDGNPCTYPDTCTGGVCAGTPYTCAPPTLCQTATCDGRGGCLVANLADGTPCNDGDVCTYGDACHAGSCTGTEYACPAVSTCTTASCDGDGGCLSGNRPPGTPCNDGNPCHKGSTCQAGACGSPSVTGACVNTAPFACVEVTPKAGLTSTTFRFDASCSSDFEDPTSALQVRFDFDGDGVFETPFSTTKTASFQYSGPGLYEAAIEVLDTGGLASWAKIFVSVAAPSDDVLVTTAADENDPGATPWNPGSTGFSLREAITYVNSLSSPPRIRFAGPMIISTNGVQLPDLTLPSASIVGQEGVVVDFQLPASGEIPCLRAAGIGDRIIALSATNCRATLFELAAAGSQAAECRLSGNGMGDGVDLSGTASILGPRNDLTGFANGCRLSAAATLVDGNRIHGGGVGILVRAGGNAIVRRNFVYLNNSDGISIGSAQTSTLVWFNTVDGNGGDAVSVAPSASSADVRDSTLTNNGRFGINGVSTVFLYRDPNVLYANASGAFSTGSPAASSVQADPAYVNRAVGDFRLLPASPAVNAGVDLGLDVTGPLPGNYSGSAPDLGAVETPY